ncbi:nucleotide exchange factor GrpE [Hahella sp. CCB-MM4]|uniref:nucleotide exchange factor GrpE n=1 Tax=Hahella sp. (strain CCB-MM4) TaxID=1926491 RepID=UPI000B9BCFE0|nr:nucleotide exchange factor GrpE [Hahella sp. CCB-MM4]OZG71688.1 nucleotide exchange factor GrpE [Hahella sp. CCB-MM4]
MSEETKNQTEESQIEETEAQAGAAGAGSAGDAESRIAALEAELAEAKDQMLRVSAEMQNVRRRAENDVEKARKFALERFVKELLPVVDSLEKAIEACSAEGDAPEQVVLLRDGVEMTLSMLMGGLKKFDVEPVDPQGQPFNPEFHEAMSMVPQPDAEPNSVIAVLQKGYTLSGRLVRPAMVMVAKG